MTASTPSTGTRGRRRIALAVLAGSQLLIVLDATIVNVALTAIRDDVNLATADLQWVITAYVLAFGGFLLLGGRLGDRFGRRRMFVSGAAAFGLGSLLCAVAWSAEVLLAGRALQGLAAAVMAPASMSLLMTVFPPGRDRDRALAVWGGVSASGTALGLILGGVLTQVLSWEWVFWVNVPIAAVAVACALAVLPESQADPAPRFDLAGAVLVTAGLSSLVYGLVQAAEIGWTSGAVTTALLVAAMLLLGFSRLQAVRPHALIPTRLLRSRNVLGGNIVGLVLGAAIYALFYFMSVFMGAVLGYGPILIGLAFVPMTIAIAVASTLAGRLIRRTGPRPLLIISALLTTIALASLSYITPDSTYLGRLLPAFLLAGFGLGLAFVALTSAAVGSAPAQDSGMAAALFNAGQQIGGALGLAVLTTVSTSYARRSTPDGGETTLAAITQGWSIGFLVAAGIMLSGLVVVVTMIRRPPASADAAGTGATDS